MANRYRVFIQYSTSEYGHKKHEFYKVNYPDVEITAEGLDEVVDHLINYHIPSIKPSRDFHRIKYIWLGTDDGSTLPPESEADREFVTKYVNALVDRDDKRIRREGHIKEVKATEVIMTRGIRDE